MKALFVVAIIASCSVNNNNAAAAAVAAAESKCLDSLNPIYESELAVTDDTQLREYILCPDTTYEIANNFENGEPKDGQYPISIFRSNVHVLCGFDGNSNNNCVLEDGHVQLGYYDKFNTNATLTNTAVKGLTFTKARYMNIEAQANGDLTIHDCVFKVGLRETKIVSSLLAGGGTCRPLSLFSLRVIY